MLPLFHRCSRLASRLAALAIAAGAASACAPDQEVAPPGRAFVTDDGRRVLDGDGQALTPPSDEPPPAIAAAFLASQGVAASTLDLIDVTRRGRVVDVAYGQRVGGLRLLGAEASVRLTEDGEVLWSSERLGSDGAVAPALLSSGQALAVAAAHLGYVGAPMPERVRAGTTVRYDGGPRFYRDPTVETVAYQRDGALVTGHLVTTWTAATNQLDETLVGADGVVVWVDHRTYYDRYRAYDESPLAGPAVTRPGPGAGDDASVRGWLIRRSDDRLDIEGQNARVYVDVDGDGLPAQAPSGTAIDPADPAITFDALVDVFDAEHTRMAAVQNVFWLANQAHDRLYRAGVTEWGRALQRDYRYEEAGCPGPRCSYIGADPFPDDAIVFSLVDATAGAAASVALPSYNYTPRVQLALHAPATPAVWVSSGGQTWLAQRSKFGPAPSVTARLAAMARGVCRPEAHALDGRIAVANVDLTTCPPATLVKNAQAAGAVAVLIPRWTSGQPFRAANTAPATTGIRIPSAMVSKADGVALRARAGKTHRFGQAPTVDPALDADIVYHEYGHALFWAGQGRSDLPTREDDALREGVADAFAMLMTDDDRIGEYTAHDGRGLRRYGFARYPLTASTAFADPDPHAAGELYAAVVWKAQENYRAIGLTDDDFFRDWVAATLNGRSQYGNGNLGGVATARAVWLQFVRTDARRACAVGMAWAWFGVGGAFDYRTPRDDFGFTPGGQPCSCEVYGCRTVTPAR